MATNMRDIRSKVQHEVDAYSQGDERPLAAYAGGIAVYSTLVTTLAGLARAQRRTLPTPTPFEVVLIATATHKLARLIAKENITSAIRAPFTQYEGTAGPAELHEEVRGHGARHAIGELITCPFCLAQWTATGFTFGLIFAPRATRLAAMTMTAVAASDFLQLAYSWSQQKATGEI
ncbi:MAG TPA: DUF1360 domain-containing protein [Frankiaceae bacterium]|nr:DUF1360 domain-containing protein [Frankiaceae bacterium]